ncbi:transporter [Sediminitomix flava]|uniref:Neuromedin U n=1 Tax=Sediminitomix flava TaxID=379075 RepID=A0A315Z8R8_SEDFL|nr:transporter [Sediminitomix flava]PWJ40839.1 hypothetical protein BC781_10498 [Sediminitomix flava]
MTLKKALYFAFTCFLIIFGTISVKAQKEELTEAQLEALARAMDNPLTQVWSLAFQNNTVWVNNNVNDDTQSANLFSFQPILPMPLGEDYLFFVRPVFNLITLPKFDIDQPDFFDGHDTGFGDIILGAGFGPKKSEGLLWGLGASFIFPTASSSSFGSGKWQLGPAGILFYIKKKFLVGTLAQQWWSVGGDSDRPRTNHASFLCFFVYNLPNQWQLRYNPNIVADWTADDGKVFFPIGLGVGKMTKLGKVPIKLMLEGQYGAVKPNLLAPFQTLPIPGAPGIDAGIDWLLRFQINFVIPSPFGDIGKILKMHE